MADHQHDASIEHLLRELAPQVLGAVARRFRDFSSAEDAVQEAMIAAFTQWPQEGVPDNPRGWLIQVACRRMTDQMRSEIARRERETAVASETENLAFLLEIEADMGPDDTLHFVVHVLPFRPHSVLGNRPNIAGGWRFNHG